MNATGNNTQAGRPPEPAHDPIAIAALIAELPELEAKYLAAKNAAEEANKALDSVQQRIDAAIATLKHKAPRGSSWHKSRVAPQQQFEIEQLYGMLENQKRGAAKMSSMSTKPFMPPSSNGSGYTP